MNTKGALRKILSNLHPNTILEPNLDSNTHPQPSAYSLPEPPPPPNRPSRTPHPKPLLDPPPIRSPPPPPPPPQGASGQQLVGGVVGVHNRGVPPPGAATCRLRPLSPVNRLEGRDSEGAMPGRLHKRLLLKREAMRGGVCCSRKR